MPVRPVARRASQCAREGLTASRSGVVRRSRASQTISSSNLCCEGVSSNSTLERLEFLVVDFVRRCTRKMRMEHKQIRHHVVRQAPGTERLERHYGQALFAT